MYKRKLFKPFIKRFTEKRGLKEQGAGFRELMERLY